MLSWEYPPLVVGGIAAHVDGLARALVRDGHEVVVLSLHHPSVPDDAVVDGVRVLRAHVDLPWVPDGDLVARMASANHHVVQLAARLGDWRPDIVHAHDWLVAWAGDTLRILLDVPLVATITPPSAAATAATCRPGCRPRSTPSSGGSPTRRGGHLLLAVHGPRGADGFELPSEKVHLVPNGVDPDLWAPPVIATPEREPLVLSWGRVQYEKGFQVLVQAIARLRKRVPDVRCVIAGRGSYLAELQTQVDIEGVNDLVTLAGFVPDDELRSMLHRAGCVVIPSLYEPFGIVALEAMASGAPTVVARTGGLAEIVEGTDAGLVFEPGNPDQLAALIEETLTDAVAARSLQQHAAELVAERYTWDAIAQGTLEVYDLAMS